MMNLEEIIRVISKPPQQRTRDEVKEIGKWLRKRSSLFKDLDIKITSVIVCNCRVSVMKKDELVIKQGDKGDKFFVILKGQVSVYVGEAKEANETESTDDPQMKKNQKKSEVETPKSRELSREDYGNKVAVFSDGRSFGELALQHSHNVRAASVITDTTTYFLVVDKDLYNKSIKAIQAEELTRLRSYIENHLLFEQWPHRLQNSIGNCMNKVVLADGIQFVRQGSKYHGIWFIVNGEVKITMDNRSELERFSKSAGGNRMDYLSSEYTQIKRAFGYTGAEKYQNSKNEDICVLRTPDTIGDIEQLLNKDHYTHSAETVGPVTLYLISSDNLKRLFTQLHKQGVYQQNQIISTWIHNAIQNWTIREDYIQTASINDVIEQLVEKLEPILKSLGITKAAKLTPRQKTFQALIDAYMQSRAPLIEPITVDGHVFKLAIQKKAERRRHFRELHGPGTQNYVRPPHHLRPLMNTKKARSIATLKKVMKKLDTTDVDILIPSSTHRQQLLPQTTDDITEQVAEQPIEQRRTRASIPNCKHDLELVQGKTLRFFSQYLKGRLDQLYEMERVPTGITAANKDVISIENKLVKFYQKERAPSAEDGSTNDEDQVDGRAFVKSLRQLDENKMHDLHPGAKCTVVTSPCRLIGKQFKVKNHNHIRRHMVRGPMK